MNRIELLERLVAFDTVSARSNLPLVDFVRDHLGRYDVDSRLIFDESGEKANLLATIGDATRPGLVLSGHTDVVPVEGQDWRHEPFRLGRSGERLIGRGAADMKGFLACVLALVPLLAERKAGVPVHIAFSYDEEVGCKGVPSLIEAMLATLPHPIGCIVGEPTGMQAVDGHKGKIAARCTVTGREGHSALPHRCVNAVALAARLIDAISDLAGRLAAEGPRIEGFEPPYSTGNVGRIEGGSQINIVPRRCVFELEFRCLPGEQPRDLLRAIEEFAATDLLPEMRRTAPDAAITFEVFLDYPGFLNTSDSVFSREVKGLSSTDTPGKVSYGTEAGHFATHGIDTMVCGPGHMSVAHRPDEWIADEQLERCERFLNGLIERLSHAG